MQVALAWLLHRSPNILLIPGTSSAEHLRENLKAGGIASSEKSNRRIECDRESRCGGDARALKSGSFARVARCWALRKMCRTYGAGIFFCSFTQPSRAGLTSGAPTALSLAGDRSILQVRQRGSLGEIRAGLNRTGTRFSPQWTEHAAHRNASYGFNACRPTRVRHSLRGPAAELRREVVWVGVHAWLRSSRKSWRLAASPQTSR
jgi:hypothetical protein